MNWACHLERFTICGQMSKLQTAWWRAKTNAGHTSSPPQIPPIIEVSEGGPDDSEQLGLPVNISCSEHDTFILTIPEPTACPIIFNSIRKRLSKARFQYIIRQSLN